MHHLLLSIALLCVSVTAQRVGIVKPPTFITPSKSTTIYIEADKREVIKCKAEGIPDPTYKWYKYDDLSTGAMHTVKPETNQVSIDASNGDLIFENYIFIHDGYYMCVATNVYESSAGRQEATSFSPVLQLLQNQLGSFKDEGNPVKTTKAREFTYKKLECTGKGNIVGDKIGYSWYVAESRDTQTQLKDENGRIYVDLDGNLHIVYLKREDQSSVKGMYHCSVGLGNTIKLGGKNYLEVASESNPAAVIPKLAYSNSGVKAKRFTVAELECVFEGYDPKVPHLPTITWEDSGYNLIRTGGRYKISDDGRRLEIKNVQEEDEGDYHCIASNSAGPSQKMPVTLNVISAPIWVTDGKPADMTLPERKNAVFNCDARSPLGEPQPGMPVWFINGARINNYENYNKDKYKWSEDKKQLTILHVRKATDTVCVSCLVSNEIGTTLGDGCLTVIYPIDIKYSPESVQKVTKGEQVNMTIQAVTDPSIKTLHYEWIFRNKTYAVSPEWMTYDGRTHEAYINTSKLTEEEFMGIGGIYRRRIWHDFDQVFVDIEVVIEGQTAPITQSAGFDMWIIGLIIGILFLIIVIIIIIFIICRKQQEGDYNVDKKETGAGLDPEKELKQQGFDDYSRPDYGDYDYPDRKPRGDLEYDDVPIGGDDESLGEYGDEEATYFNEDGSFIGIYQNHEAPKKPPPAYSAESTI